MDIKNITVGIFTLIVSCTFTSCSFDDNYDGPNASFHGQLIDDITNGPMYSEQPNGFQIRFKVGDLTPNLKLFRENRMVRLIGNSCLDIQIGNMKILLMVWQRTK